MLQQTGYVKVRRMHHIIISESGVIGQNLRKRDWEFQKKRKKRTRVTKLLSSGEREREKHIGTILGLWVQSLCLWAEWVYCENRNNLCIPVSMDHGSSIEMNREVRHLNIYKSHWVHWNWSTESACYEPYDVKNPYVLITDSGIQIKCETFIELQ